MTSNSGKKRLIIMQASTCVTPRIFTAIQNVDICELSMCSHKEIRPILPCLVRMSLISPLDITRDCVEERKQVLTILSGIESVNSIIALLSIDFHALETDVRKEQQLRQKLGSLQRDSVLAQSLQSGLALEFERSESTRRIRLVLSELLYVASQVQELQKNQEFQIKQSDLFDNAVYMEEISYVICIALAELPTLLSILDIAETLLHVKHGPEIICWIVANIPDSFNEVCAHLIANGERQEESPLSRIRTMALTMLCQMNPSQALAIRAKCVELCRMPALAITLSLEHESINSNESESDIVAFVSGLLLGSDQQVRTWIAMFIRNGQKRKWESHTALQSLREELLKRLQVITAQNAGQLAESQVVQASALLRLYCALRGIGGIKFQDDEVAMIVQLLTSHPPPSPAGVRFVSLGLCMLIACSSLIGHHNLEKRSIEWVQWLVREEAYFESASGVTASFGEMLLLMAIHFHSNQLSAICELVCATLGMKIPIRPNNLTRMKQIFMQEIFTEQVVTAHAVKVPVTANLNANIPGFLPVHCIHQLLKSRAFAKHRVPIKNWIYKQICNSVPPLHPVLPALVEVYVNSIVLTNNKTSEHTNKPITEDEIRRVFQNSVFGANFDIKKGITAPHCEIENTDVDISKPSLTSQLLLLYYLLLYEDVRLSNMHTFISQDRKVKSYSTEFLSELPIKYLLQLVQRDQMNYAGLFSPLLRLLATHFPHLSLVDDWLDNEMINIDSTVINYENVKITDIIIIETFSHIQTCPSRTGRLLRQLMSTKPIDIWPHAEVIIYYFKAILSEGVPRYIQELYKQVWLRLNTVLPRCLWVLSINALLIENSIIKNVFLTQENIVLDPLQVLRCDTRVFRCAPILSIIIRILQAALAASRSQLSRHIQDKPLTEKIGQLTSDTEREDLRTALVAGQESAAVQILLEACLETKEDRETPGQMWSLREIRSIICSYLHQVFIADPSLAKLVHFQGYPRELLPITVTGIPSMHICLDWIPELLSQPESEKQIFAVDLASHLAIQYALPKALSVSRLAINTMVTLLGVLSAKDRVILFIPVLPALTRICLAFPPLAEDTTGLLLQLGRVNSAQAALGDKSADILCREVSETFCILLQKAILQSQTDVLLPGVSSSMMNLLLEYAYLRSINVNKENVCQLLVTADYLNILGVLDLCSEFLKQNLVPENCISVMRFAREHFCKGLENSAYRYVMRHFVQVAQRSEEILNLPIEELTTLIGADELNVKNEDTVWELVLKWIDHDPQSRKGYIADLMKNIRLGLLDTQFFHENVKDHPYVTGNVACRPIIIETLKFIYELEIITQKDREVPTPKIARPRVPHEILFAIGGWSGRTATNFIETYDTRADRWVKVEEVDPSGPRSYHGTAAVGFNIYVIGGFDGTNYFNSCRCFNAVTKVWREVAPMNARRCYVGVAVHNDLIYAMGGYDGYYRQNTAERYNYKTNQWSLIAPMKCHRSDASATTLNGKIYITGGFNGNECLNSAEMYDPECNQWTLIATMRSRRSGVSCIAYHNCVYVIGGFNGISRMSSGEKYNPATNTWSPIPDMYHARSNFGIEVIDDMIFAIGGYNSVTTIYHVECYDEKTNEWYEATDMNIYRSAVSACVIVGLPNVNDYIHKHRERLMEEKRQKLLALEVPRSQQQHQQDQAQQNRENLLADEIIPAPPPMPRNNNSNNENQQN